MNFLLLLDNCNKFCGANVNIANNVASELRNRGNNVSAISKYNDKNDIDNEKALLYDKLFYVCTRRNIITSNVNWDELNSIRKFGWVLLHPIRLFKYIYIRHFGEYYEMLKKRLKEVSYDYIIVFSSPIDIALNLTKVKTSAKKILIELDPYTTNVTFPMDEKQKRKRKELKIINKMDFVFAVKYHFGDMVSEFGKYKEKIISIDLPALVRIPMNNNEVKGNVVFSFAGMLYSDIRNPQYMLSLFSKMPTDIKVYIAGVGEEKTVKEFCEISKGKIEFLGKISLEDAYSLMNQSDFLINLNNSMKNQIPSKLFEYMGTGLPIVNICKNRDCPSLEYTSKYPLCINLFEEDPIEDSISKLCRFVDQSKGHKVEFDVVKKIFIKNTIPYFADMILKVVENR